MNNLPLSLRDELTKSFPDCTGKITDHLVDKDTIKLGIVFPESLSVTQQTFVSDNVKIESVLLCDNKERQTACLSTQAGCPIRCVFCKTGSLGFSRNLNSGEIVQQFLFLRGIAESEGKTINNIVVMGMGEPLLNIDELRKAISVITDPKGINFSRRRITVSTCGIYKGIIDLCENGPYVRLALSLVTGDESIRQRLMPGIKNEPLNKIKEAIFKYQQKSGRITLEIVMLGGINTDEKNANSIAEFADGLDVVINLIPWNPCQGLEFEKQSIKEPSKQEILAFEKFLIEKNLKVTRRLSKGRGVSGACGQLGHKQV